LLKKEDFSIVLSINNSNKLTVQCHAPSAVEYAYHICKNDVTIDKFYYTENAKLNYWLSESGRYKAKAYAKDEEGNYISKYSEEVEFDIEQTFYIEQTPIKKVSVWERVCDTVKDIYDNRFIISKMAAFDYQLENKDTYLGKIWSLITPLLQIGTYWLVFGIGLRSGKDVNGFPFLAWMLVGLVPWFFISGCITKGANAIYAKAGLFSRMKFCIATAPISKIVQEMYEFIVMLFIMLAGLLFMGIWPNLYWLNAIYYAVYCVIFLISLALVTSVLTMVARDFFKLLSSLIRLLFYLTPILWVMDDMPMIYQNIMKCSPVYYVINGFRNSILYRISFFEDMKMVAIMWAVNIVLFVCGCVLQSKFKNKFIDLM